MDYTSMEKLALFRGLTAPEIRQVCDCFGTHVKTFTKGDIIFKKGAAHTHFGVVFDTRPNECEFLAHIKELRQQDSPKDDYRHRKNDRAVRAVSKHLAPVQKSLSRTQTRFGRFYRPAHEHSVAT